MSPELIATGQRITALRMAQGLTQQRLADAVGLARSSIANIEGGRQDSPLRVMVAIAAALGTTVGEFTGTDAVRMPWVELSLRTRDSQREYEKLAEQCWASHDYLTAIRYRGVAEGLAMALTHQVGVARDGGSSDGER